jgi:hypothetical protein
MKTAFFYSLLFVALIFASLSLNAQGILGGAGVTVTNADPDNVTALQSIDVRYESVLALDTVTYILYQYDHQATSGNRWNRVAIIDADLIEVDPSGNLSATDVQAALEELQIDIDNLIASGGSDGVTSSAALDAPNQEADFTVTGATNYSLDLSTIGTFSQFSAWDKNAADDFDGAWGSLSGIPADIADGDDVLSQEEVEDFAGGMFSGNTETRITATYDDVSGKINLVVDAETDPVYSGDPASGILAGDITNWDTAFGWGDHSTQGYINNYQTVSGGTVAGGGSLTLSNSGGTLNFLGGAGLTVAYSAGDYSISNDQASEGDYLNHSDAGTNGVAIGEWFTASTANTMGVPAGTLVKRAY